MTYQVKNVIMKNIITYAPFTMAVLFTIVFAVLYFGSNQYLDLWKVIDWRTHQRFWYNELVYFVLDHDVEFFYYPQLCFAITILLKIFKQKIFWFYITLILSFANILCHEFLWGIWKPW